MRNGSPGRRVGASTARWVVLALWCSLAAASALAAGSASEAEARLREVRERIERVSHELADDLKARDRQSAELRQTELTGSAIREDLARLGLQQQELERKRQALERARNAVEAELVSQRQALAGELRLAQRVGRTGPLQLLLSQREPLRAGRMLTYYGYFGRARATQIDAVRVRGQQLEALDLQLHETEAQVTVVSTERRKKLAEIEAERRERAEVLAGLQRESQSRVQTLARLRSQQADLEKLLRDLARSLRDAPAPALTGAFAALRGRLSWPVAGSLLAQYGQQRAQGVRWEGVLLATERAAEVHAIAAGRVVYADWLPGLGLLTIIDHGGGYLSLYGHNDALRRPAGELVEAGDVIASAGDTGGSSRPALYFEIRQAGKPVDPAPWFRHRRPD